MAPIALLTDFGTSDYFVAAMKGKILSIYPTATIVDITHHVPAQDIRAGYFILRSCCLDFPAGTVFVCVVDPGVGSARRPIVVRSRERTFVGPDNGLFSFLFEDPVGFDAFRIENPAVLAEDISSTFHGRDIFAPAAAHIASGFNVRDIGQAISDPVRIELPELQRRANDELAGEVIHVDHFGNLVTNFRPADVTPNTTFSITGHTVDRFVSHYAEAKCGEVTCITGSSGYVEIASVSDSAAKALSAGVGDEVIAKS